MATIYVDGKAHHVDPGKNLLESCLSLGYDLPYFCWHPSLGSVGACRQCAVTQYQDEHDTRGRIVMSCMTPSAEGTRIGLADAGSSGFRASVIEWLMLNHPHDCAVCEEGGECHLQDMTVMTGHSFRRYRGKKRTYRNQDLGPFLTHEMNRCITCYRCVRFYGDYAGGHDLVALASKNWVYFGRHEDGTLENEFSGNLAEVCPTGVFTDRAFSERYNRKWDLRAAPSICRHCSLGCNISPNERHEQVRRILNRYHGEINGYFICDRGRYGYEYVNSERRIAQPLACADGAGQRTLSPQEALAGIIPLIGEGKRIIGIGSPAASLEDNYALRTLVGADNFYTGLAAHEQALVERVRDILREGPVRTPSLREVEQCDAVLILGEDVSNTAPRLALALRQATRHAAWKLADGLGIARWNDAVIRNAAGDLRSPVFIAASTATRLDDIAARTWRAAPDDIARLGFAIAHALDTAAPAVEQMAETEKQWVNAAAAALSSAKCPLIVSGTGIQSIAVIEAAANIARALHLARYAAFPAAEHAGENVAADSGVRLAYALPHCNAMGLALLGGSDLQAAFAAVEAGAADMVITLENDLYGRANGASVDAMLRRARLICIDYLRHETNARAAYVLPGGTFAESDGTLVNNEGRAQRYYQLYPPQGAIREAWRWLRELIEERTGHKPPWENLDHVTQACAAAIPGLARICDAAPPASYRIAGMKIVREPPRYSGRTAMTANVSVHEPKPPSDPDTPLSYTMEGYYGEAPGALLPFSWAPRWNSHQQAITKFQDEVGGHLRGGDPGVRLFEPAPDARMPYFANIPQAFARKKGELLTIPLYHIFGSEPLSLLSPGIAQRAPALYVALSPADAQGLKDGEQVAIDINGMAMAMSVHLRDDLPQGVAGMPYLPATASMSFPLRIALRGPRS